MPLVRFEPYGKELNADPGTSLFELAKRASVPVDAPCGGKGACGKCIVRIASGNVVSDSLGVLTSEELADGYVLACKTSIADDDLVVEVPELADRKGGKFSSAEDDARQVRQELFPQNWQFDPLAVKWFVQVKEPQLEDGLSDIDRLSRAIQHDWGMKRIVYSLPVLRRVAGVLREDAGAATVTMIRDGEQYHIIGVEAGNKTDRHYGVAIDLGTTTVAVQLIYLPTATRVGTLTDYNDQISCGLDVISRINYAARPGHLEELRAKALDTINHLIGRLSAMYKVDASEICNAVVSGNTTMMHLLLGLNPEFIRLSPYVPTIMKAPYLTASDVGVHINPQSWIYLSPCVGSYVGGDITAGVLCTGLAQQADGLSLFIDIGTNGEIVIGNSEFIMSCACSAGPAFEGGGIKHGMRAALGAIEGVEVDPDNGTVRYQVIGGVKPKGICGSGMISLLAKLLLSGWLDSAGRLDRSRPSPAIKVSGRTASYILASPQDSDSGEEITISEVDFENIIRTKAAIYSACSLMLSQLEMSFDDLTNIYIAGGFGRFLDLEMAIAIGLLPDLDRSKFKYIGNSSLTGSYMVLVSQEFREAQLEMASKITYLDLNSSPDYMNQYTSALFLPHTDIDLFPSVKARMKG